MTSATTVKRDVPKVEFEKVDGKTRLIFILDVKDDNGRELVKGRIGEFINVRQSDKNVVRDAVAIGIGRMHYFKKEEKNIIAKEVLAKLPSARK